MRVPWAAVVGGVAVTVLGAAGLVRAAVPQGAAGPGTSSDVAPIVVTGAFVRAPVPPTKIAAAYFTVRNTTAQPDLLQSVITGAGASADLHVVQSDGSMSVMATGVTVPAHGTLTLRTGQSHVMIEGLYGTLKAGETVNIDLQFRDAGPISVVAPVVAIGAPAPTGTVPSGEPS